MNKIVKYKNKMMKIYLEIENKLRRKYQLK